jgi:large subunit ribosomal protein L17
VAALLTYERIRTTDVKAKETRRLAERAITWARRLGDVLTKSAEKRTPEEQARVVHAIRMALRVVRNREAVLKLFEEIAPRYLTRHGGYTRIVKIGQRPGDAAPMSLLELIPGDGASGEAPKQSDEAKVKEKKAARRSAKEASAKVKASPRADGSSKAKKAVPAKTAAVRRTARAKKGGE